MKISKKKIMKRMAIFGLVLILLFGVFVPVVQAIAFPALFATPILGSSITAGHALLTSLAISIGTYIALEFDEEIDYLITSVQTSISGLWNRLTNVERQEIEQVAQTSLSGSDAEYQISNETMDKIYDYAISEFTYVRPLHISTYGFLANYEPFYPGTENVCGSKTSSTANACRADLIANGYGYQLTDQYYYLLSKASYDAVGNFTTIELDIFDTNGQWVMYFNAGDYTVKSIYMYTSNIIDQLQFSNVNSMRFDIPRDMNLKPIQIVQPLLDQISIGIGLNVPDIGLPPRAIDYPDRPRDVAIPIPGGAVIPGTAEGTYDISLPIAQSIGESIVDVATGNPAPSPGGPGSGNNVPWAPWAMVLAFLDMLRAIAAYLIRLLEFIVTLPMIPSVPLENAGFQMFMDLSIGSGSRYFPNLLPINVSLLNVIQTILTIFMSLAVYRVIKRMFT